VILVCHFPHLLRVFVWANTSRVAIESLTKNLLPEIFIPLLNFIFDFIIIVLEDIALRESAIICFSERIIPKLTVAALLGIYDGNSQGFSHDLSLSGDLSLVNDA
jgi:hypothetical protein